MEKLAKKYVFNWTIFWLGERVGQKIQEILSNYCYGCIILIPSESTLSFIVY